MKYAHVLIVMSLFACVPVSQTTTVTGSNETKTLQLRDMVYEPQIKTVLLHPGNSTPENTLLAAVTSLSQSSLMLEFDDLINQRDTYYAKIIHCNYDWTKSMLNDLDFLEEYNEFPINNYEFSVDTHIPYVHYWLNLPAVKLPGNYVVIVYRGSNKEDLILSRRFLVFDNQIIIGSERNLVGAGAVAERSQQINFTINYKNLEVINPLDNVKVNIRQNQRWDNVAEDVRPSFVREIEKQLEYRFFDDTKMFQGGNEFRFFDMRSLNYPGRNVARVDKTIKPFEVYLDTDKSRSTEAYSQYPDYNGSFVLDNLDYQDANFSNYANIHFSLYSPKSINGKVYFTGAFTNWNLNNDNLMVYDSASQQYRGTFLMKQGWYDYQYWVQSPGLPPFEFEGSHFETENVYEIFVYYRPMRPQADLLVGYLRLEKNQR